MAADSGGRRAAREALLLAMFPFIAISLLNHFSIRYLLTVHPAWFWALDLIQFVLAPLIAWQFALRPLKLGQQDYGLVMPGNKYLPKESAGEMLFAALLMVAAFWPIHVILEGMLWRFGSEIAVRRAMPTALPWSLLVPIYMSVSAALVEEMAYRSLPWLYCSLALPERWRNLVYVAATSLVFAFAHSEQGPAGIFSALWFGLIAATMYLKLRSLWPLVLGHFLIDMIVFGPW